MGRNKSTISRELSRNTGKRGYLAISKLTSASINNTGALINVNAIRHPTSIIIFAIAFSIFLMLMLVILAKEAISP
jgi:hypothetical protein